MFTSLRTLLGLAIAKLGELAMSRIGSELTKLTAPTGTTPSTTIAGSGTPVQQNDPSSDTSVASSAPESGSKSTRKTLQISLIPDNLTEDEAAAMVDYLRGKYGLPAIMDRTQND